MATLQSMKTCEWMDQSYLMLCSKGFLCAKINETPW